MPCDFIEDLLRSLHRVLTPDEALLRDILIVCGMPEKTQNLRYLCFNRHVVQDGDQTLTFSATAVINNRRTSQWRLKGYRKKISRMVFNARWTYNPMDYFINNLRGDSEVMDILSSSPGAFSLMGILKVKKRKLSTIRPVVAVPCIDAASLEKIAAFEADNEIRESGIRGVPLYWKLRHRQA